MAPNLNIRLDQRALLALSGDDTLNLLQGLITNDVERLTPTRAIYAALLTPQGKFLHDFFAFEIDRIVYLDCEAARRDDLARRLKMYRLRSKVDIAPVDRGSVYALTGESALSALQLSAPGDARSADGGIVYADPRHAGMGARAWLTESAVSRLADAGFETGALADYDRLRVGLGVPDGSRDLIVEDMFALEGCLEEMNGVDFEKGCYVGQEVTARMKHRDLVRKRILPVRIEGAPPVCGAEIRNGDVGVGQLRSVADGRALALLRLDQLDAETVLTADGATVIPE